MLSRLPLTRLVDGTHANGRAHALCKQDLVILSAKASHENPKNVQEAANEDDPSGPIPVIQHADDGTLFA
jgi:hypothetical protein